MLEKEKDELNVIKLFGTYEMDKKLFFHKINDNQNQSQIMDVFYAVRDVYKSYAKKYDIIFTYCHWYKKSYWSDWEYDIIREPFDLTVGKFISKIVIGYLFDCMGKWKLECLRQNINKELNCGFVYSYRSNINYNIHLYRKSLKLGYKEVDISLLDMVCSCDICRLDMIIFDNSWHCNSHPKFTHDICNHCIYDVIKKNEQLNELLTVLLDTYELNKQLIQEIVAFTVGKAIKI